MVSPNSSQPDSQLQAKVNLLSGILRLGHEAFDRDGVDEIGAHIVNNSRLLIDYDRCCLVAFNKKRPRIVAISGQTIVAKESEYSSDIRTFTSGFSQLDDIVIVTQDTIDQHTSSSKARKSFKRLGNDNTIILVPLTGGDPDEQQQFIWVVEFFDGCDPSIENSLSLLGKHYGQALALKKSGQTGFSIFRGSRGHRLKKTAAIICLIAMLASLFIVRINQSVIADCELTPLTRQFGYAPFNGSIRKSFFKDGDRVKKGDVIVAYDIEEMLFELADARKQEEIINAELDLVRQQSFSSMEQLGQVKVLELKRRSRQIDIERNNWYIEHSRVETLIDGALIIDDPEHFSGKAIKAGEKLFEVVNPAKLIVTIFLHESDSSILSHLQPQMSFFLDARPEKKLKADIQTISPKPMLTETGQFAYRVKALPRQDDDLINGMRGVARLHGGKILLINYLFKNLLLWWRKV